MLFKKSKSVVLQKQTKRSLRRTLLNLWQLALWKSKKVGGNKMSLTKIYALILVISVMTVGVISQLYETAFSGTIIFALIFIVASMNVITTFLMEKRTKFIESIPTYTEEGIKQSLEKVLHNMRTSPDFAEMVVKQMVDCKVLNFKEEESEEELIQEVVESEVTSESEKGN